MNERKEQNPQKKGKITLRGYYQSLPDAQHPKTDFIIDIAHETGVSATTVRNWIIYGMKPANNAHVDVLVKKTGIPAEELWEE